MKLFLLFLLSMVWSACQQNPSGVSPVPAQKVSLPLANTHNYWYQGKAEISSYTVIQERYGEQRQAGQVMVFVTEDFSAKKQVKLDAAPEPGDERVPILKLNTVRRFNTGIYDYSLVQSVFTPTGSETTRSLKTTTTIQDWCGQVFVQCNAQDKGYRVKSFSYFEMEGDTEKDLNPGLLEDEIWSRLRLHPESLASMKTTVLPAVFYSRFRHKPLQPEPAEISIEKNGGESTLRLVYTHIPRRLSIRFETEFPHRILGWEESDAGKLLSKGTLKKTILDDYWNHHDEASAPLRAELNPGY